MKSNHLLALLALAAMGCSASAASLSPAMSGELPMGVRVVAPSPSLDKEMLLVTGTVHSRQEAVLSAQTGGVVSQLAAQVGDRVKRGQVLARLDAEQPGIAVQQARATLAAAKASFDGADTNLQRTRMLVRSDSLPKATLDQAEVTFRQAQAQVAQASAGLKSAEKILRDTSITAPFSGVITSRNKGLGDLVASGTPMFTLVDTDALEVRAQAPESLVDSARKGAVLEGRLVASGATFQARISSLGATIDVPTRTVVVIAEVLGAKDGAIVRPGALVQLDLSSNPPASDTAIAHDGALFLPTNAVSADSGEPFVWVVQDGKATRRPVTVEKVLPGVVRVNRGLESHERVVADASLRLRDGASVQVVQ